MTIAAGFPILAADVTAAINHAQSSATNAQNAATTATPLAAAADSHATPALQAANTAAADAAAAKAQTGGLQQQIANVASGNASDKASVDQQAADIGALTNRVAALEARGGVAPPTVPSPPTSPTSTAVTPTSVSLSATAPASGPAPTSYKWEYKRSIDTTFLLSSVVTLTGTQSGLASGTAYDFRISAVNAAGPSAPSGVYTVSTATAPVLVESAHATALTTTSGQIVDSALNAWTLIPATGGAADFQIAINGVRQTITGAVVLMEYYNPPGPAVSGTTKRSVVHENSAGGWYISTGVTGNIASFVQISGDPFSATTGGSAGPGLGPAFQDLAGGSQAMTGGGRCSTGMTTLRNDVPGFSGYEVQIKPFVINAVAYPGVLGTYFGPNTAAFVDRRRYLWTPDVAPIYSATDCPPVNPGINPVANIRLPVGWWTAGSTVASAVSWGLFYEPGFDVAGSAFSVAGEVYAVITDYNVARGDTFHVTSNMSGRGVVLTKPWGSVLDFSGESSGNAPYGLGWIAFIGVNFVKSSIRADW